MKHAAVFSKPHQAFFKLVQEDGRLGVRLCDLEGFKTNPGQTTRLCPKDCVPAEEMIEQQIQLAGHKLNLLQNIRSVVFPVKKAKTILGFMVDFFTSVGCFLGLVLLLVRQLIQQQATRQRKNN